MELVNRNMAKAIFNSLNSDARTALAEISSKKEEPSFSEFYSYLTEVLISDVEYDLGVDINRGDL